MALSNQCFGYLDSGEKIIYDTIPVPVDTPNQKPVEQQEIHVMVRDTEYDFCSTEPFAFKNGDEVFVAIRDNRMITPGGEIKFNFHYEDGDVETCVESCDSVISVCAKSEYTSIFRIHDLCAEDCMPEGPMIVSVIFDGTLHAKSGVVFYSDDTGCIVHSDGPRAKNYEVLFPGTYKPCPAKAIKGRETKDLCCDTIVKIMLEDMPKGTTNPKSLCDFMETSTRNEHKYYLKAIEDSKVNNDFDEGKPVKKKPRISREESFNNLLSIAVQ